MAADGTALEDGVVAESESRGGTSNWSQFVVAFSGVLGMMSCGMQFSWSSPALPKIESENLGFSLSVEDESWIVSVLNLSAIAGSFLSGSLVDHIGRKLCMLLTSLPFAAFWLLVYFGHSAAYLYAARLIAGVGVGMSLNVVPMYLGEIATSGLRGAIGALTMFMMNLGVLFEYGLGPILSYGELAWASLAVPVVSFLLFVTMPESPYYHVMKGEVKQAKRCIKRLRHTKSANVVDGEVKQIVLFLEEKERSKVSFREAVSSRGNRRALIMVLILAFLQQSTGISAILAYFESIVDKDVLPLSLDLSYVLVALLQILSCAASSCVVDRLGRRPLFIGSCLLLFVTHGLLGAFFFVKEHEQIDVSTVGIAPLVLVMIVIVAYNGGQGPLVYVLMGECLSQEVKAFGATGAAVLISVMAFAITKIYPSLTAAVGTFASFWMFSGLSLITALYVIFVVPETKGKTMNEIQEYFFSSTSKRKEELQDTAAEKVQRPR